MLLSVKDTEANCALTAKKKKKTRRLFYCFQKGYALECVFLSVAYNGSSFHFFYKKKPKKNKIAFDISEDMSEIMECLCFVCSKPLFKNSSWFSVAVLHKI